MSTKVWTLPKHKLHLQNCSHAYISKYSHWLLPMVCHLAWWHRKYKWMMHVHISTHKLMQHCQYEYNPPVHNKCHRYIYITAVNVHRSNLRKTGVLKLLQDNHINQLLIKTQTLVIVLTYSLTTPQNS